MRPRATGLEDGLLDVEAVRRRGRPSSRPSVLSSKSSQGRRPRGCPDDVVLLGRAASSGCPGGRPSGPSPRSRLYVQGRPASRTTSSTLRPAERRGVRMLPSQLIHPAGEECDPYLSIASPPIRPASPSIFDGQGPLVGEGIIRHLVTTTQRRCDSLRATALRQSKRKPSTHFAGWQRQSSM